MDSAPLICQLAGTLGPGGLGRVQLSGSRNEQHGPQNVDCLASTHVEVQVRGQAPYTESDESPGRFQLDLILVRHAPADGTSGELLTEVKVQLMHAKWENVCIGYLNKSILHSSKFHASFSESQKLIYSTKTGNS